MAVHTQVASSRSRAVADKARERSRREIFRQTRAMVFAASETWGRPHSVTRISGPRLARADIEAAFDELCEKHHVAGIELRFAETRNGNLEAIFTPREIGPPACEGRREHLRAWAGSGVSGELDLRGLA